MTPLLEARGVCKRYGHVEALRDANFEAYPGEVTALVGDNGAGKSTLVKILSGAAQPDSGTILLNGAPVEMATPIHARQLGIETVYQDLALAPELGPAENAFIGREKLKGGLLGRLGVLDKAAMREEAARAFTMLGTDVKDLDVPVASLSGGQRQTVAICRAVMWARHLVIMDEPTAALGVRQRANVLAMIRKTAEQGIAVILISHNMPEVLATADRIEVFRLGERVAQLRSEATNQEELVGAMTGAFVGGGR